MNRDGGWVIVGCRTDFAPEIAEIVWRRGEHLLALVDNLTPVVAPDWAAGTPVIAPEQIGSVTHGSASIRAVVPQTTPGHRFAVHCAACTWGLSRFDALVDPTAVVSRTAQVGPGAVVNAAAIIGALASVGDFAVVNRGAGLGHHSRIGEFATLGPGCVLAGAVEVGRGSFVGAGAVVAPRVTIGSNATIGAGAVVLADVPADTVVVGNPARVVRSGDPGFGGVHVPEPAT